MDAFPFSWKHAANTDSLKAQSFLSPLKYKLSQRYTQLHTKLLYKEMDI